MSPVPVGAFHVMAVLQYARAILSGLPESEARSWGAQRALQFALFKGGRIHQASPLWTLLENTVQGELSPAQQKTLPVDGIGDDKIPFDGQPPSREFVFAGKPVPPRYFDLVVRDPIGPNWEKALAMSLEKCKQESRYLKNRLDFMARVFRPVSTDWARAFRPAPPQSESPDRAESASKP